MTRTRMPIHKGIPYRLLMIYDHILLFILLILNLSEKKQSDNCPGTSKILLCGAQN